MKWLAPVACVLVAAGCGGGSAAPSQRDPGAFAVTVVQRIAHNRYRDAWSDLITADRKIAPRDRYVSCESRDPVTAAPKSIEVLGSHEESVAVGNGMFVASTAVRLRLHFGGSALTKTVHVVNEGGRWRWILPALRYRQYQGSACPAGVSATVTA